MLRIDLFQHRHLYNNVCKIDKKLLSFALSCLDCISIKSSEWWKTQDRLLRLTGLFEDHIHLYINNGSSTTSLHQTFILRKIRQYLFNTLHFFFLSPLFSFSISLLVPFKSSKWPTLLAINFSVLFINWPWWILVNFCASFAVCFLGLMILGAALFGFCCFLVTLAGPLDFSFRFPWAIILMKAWVIKKRRGDEIKESFTFYFFCVENERLDRQKPCSFAIALIVSGAVI